MPPQRSKTPRKKNSANTQTEPVEVCCRIRPLDNPNHAVCLKAVNTTTCILVPQENAIARNGQIKELQYQFQYVFDEYTSQKAVFDYVAHPLIEDLIKGKNGLLFTYGITSSGKTYTMTGTPEDQGLMPRVLDILFNSINGLQAKKYVFKPDKMNGFEIQTDAEAMMERQRREILPGLTTPKTPSRGRHPGEFGEHGRMCDPTRIEEVDEGNVYSVFVSYIEIYNNYVYDLLEELPHDPITGYRPPQSKILRTDSNDNMYVMNCVEVEIQSPQEAFEVLYKGQKRRKVAHTALNAESSRSHSIFNIRLVQAPVDSNTDHIAQVQDTDKNICVSQLSLVDLAGSERTHRTKNTGDRIKEAGNINQSLMVLRNCIELLRENQKTGLNKLVPYRDSKLTHLFKNYFDGDGKVRMVVCVNPKAEEYDETIHVMKFAEMTQEVLVTKSQQVKFDIMPTPVKKLPPPIIEDYVPLITYSMGPSFPSLEVLHSSDEYTLDHLSEYLEERHRLRENLLIDFSRKQDQFRAQLVKIEKEYNEMKSKARETQSLLDKRDSYVQKLESRLRSLEKRQDDTTRQLKESEREKRDMEQRVQDKNMKIRQEKSEKERLRSDFRSRLEHNNQQWEKNMMKERTKIETELEGQIHEKQQKLNILKSIVNEHDTDTPPARFRTPAPKSRTYTTPAKIMSARSETDMTSVGRTPVPTPRTRTQTATVSSAKSMHGLNRVGMATPKNTPQYNPRHRRSRSSNAEVWLDHRPAGQVELGTVLQPKLKKKKSVSKLEVKDTKEANKYLLTSQGVDSCGELETKLIKGDMIKTAGGGTAVVFNDVETLKQTSPGSRKRRSSCPQPSDFDGEWTDVEERCGYAIEGHSRKRSRGTERVSRV